MRKLLFLFLLFGGATHAQAIQVKACPTTGFVEPCTFDNPVIAGDLVVAIAFQGCNPSMFNNLIEACSGISDSEGNAWKTAILGAAYYNYVPLWYALNVKGGPETVTFAPKTGRLAFIAEYPPSSGLADANYGSYQGQNPNGDAQGDSSDFGLTLPVLASQGDLLIAWGWSGGPLIGDGVAENAQYIIQPGPHFTMRGQQYGGFALEDSIAPVEGVYIGAIHWAGYGHWVLSVAAFKMKKP